MSLRIPHVTLTRFARDVRPFARYITTSAPRPFPSSLSTLPNRMQSIERTKQITNQLQSANQQRNYANNMAPTNNPELTMDKVFPVKDKVALVTGGGSGIGLMITQTLAVNGAKVYIVGRTEEKLEKVVEVHGQNIAGQVSFRQTLYM
jgi:FlaA1/EpsC-like NDP-sugar epimerase